MKKWIVLLAALTALLLLAVGCSGVDVVKKYSLESWNKLQTAFPTIISDTGDAYEITSDGETKLIVNKDYASTDGDILLMTPLAPFTDAGLDLTKLGDGYIVDETSLYAMGEYGAGNGKKATVSDALFESAALDRSVLTYHKDLDHYGITLKTGKFEFAKDYTNNDKDLVYVLWAAPLRDAGVDVQHVEGWTFKTMQDEKGNNVDVLLKPYNLG